MFYQISKFHVSRVNTFGPPPAGTGTPKMPMRNRVKRCCCIWAPSESLQRLLQVDVQRPFVLCSADTCQLHPDIQELIDAIQVSSAEVCELLSTLDISKATGPDNLSVVILNNCATSLSPSLTAFINASLRSVFYVSGWKQANISPIHRKGSRQEIENYREISLFPVVAKIQEKCVAKKFIPHINAILHPSQHGFKQGLSCTSQLLEVLQNIGVKLDKGHETDIIYLDFAKAFDSVCHRRLLWKLQHYGVSGPLLKWFENYLIGRKQFNV